MGSNSLSIAITGDINEQKSLEVFTKVQKAVTADNWDIKRFIITSAATKSIFSSPKGPASMPCTYVDIKSSQPEVASASIVKKVMDTIQECTDKHPYRRPDDWSASNHSLQYSVSYGVKMVSSEMGMVTEVYPNYEAIGKTEGVKA